MDTLWSRDAVAEYAAARFGVRRSRWVWGRWLRRARLHPPAAGPSRRLRARDKQKLGWQVRRCLRIGQKRRAILRRFFKPAPVRYVA
jgi:hypothetical protein